jgi:hypothetical protein
MTSPVDERGAEASRKFRVLLMASLLIVFGSNIVAVSLPWIGRSLEALRCRPVGQRLRAHLISERETAPMRAEAPARMPCKLIDRRTRSDGPERKAR